MFVGETGIGRVIDRTLELMKEHDTDDISPFGGVNLPLLQKYMNFHFSVSVDLFGSELSTNAANYYTMGLKGRFEETRKDDDHLLKDASHEVMRLEDGRFVMRDEPALQTLNEALRDDYVLDCQRGVDRWNKAIARAGVDFRLGLPHRAFHRRIGQFASAHCTPEGKLIPAEEWNARCHEWLPTDEDQKYVESLMKPVYEPGRFAAWIAPPRRGINGRPADFEYVRFN